MITVNVEEPDVLPVEIGEVTEVKAEISLQEKSIIPTKSLQNVTADEGFDGLSAVNIDPIPDEYVIQNLQEKTIIPTKSAQDVTADEDYTGLSSVHVEPIPDEYIKPDGSMDITENGTFDVTEKAEVKVDVPTSALKISQVENMLILR